MEDMAKPSPKIILTKNKTKPGMSNINERGTKILSGLNKRIVLIINIKKFNVS